jgi:hypothetical protein
MYHREYQKLVFFFYSFVSVTNKHRMEDLYLHYFNKALEWLYLISEKQTPHFVTHRHFAPERYLYSFKMR